MIRIVVDDRELSDALRRLRSRAEDLSPFMADAAELILTVTEEAFDAQRSPDGTPWPDLAPATWKRKRTRRKLYESGNLQGSLSADSDAHSATVGVGATSRGFAYGIVHQLGSRRVPARPFLPVDESGALTESVKEELLELLERYLGE